MRAFLKIIWCLMVCVGLWNFLAPKNLCWLEPKMFLAFIVVLVILSCINIFLWVEKIDL